MIDNRPKKHRPIHPPAEEQPAPLTEKPAELHSSAVSLIKAPANDTVVSAKSIPASPLAGLGAGIGNLGVLPIVLLISSLQKGRGQQGVRQSAAPPVLPGGTLKNEPAQPVKESANGKPAKGKPNTATGSKTTQGAPVTAAATAQPEPAPQAGRKPRSSLRAYRKPAPEKPPEPAPTIADAPDPAPQQARQPRPSPKPHEIRNLLSDLSGYLPGTGSMSAARISKIMGIAEELRNLDGSAGVFASSAAATANPMDRNIGLLNALSRNLPMTGASHLGRASQVLTLVNTLSSSGGSGGLGNLSNMAGMIGGMMNQNQNQNQSQHQEMKNVTPSQAEGLKDTVNKLLSGMDEKQKNDLLDKAKNFLGKGKK